MEVKKMAGKREKIPTKKRRKKIYVDRTQTDPKIYNMGMHLRDDELKFKGMVESTFEYADKIADLPDPKTYEVWIRTELKDIPTPYQHYKFLRSEQEKNRKIHYFLEKEIEKTGIKKEWKRPNWTIMKTPGGYKRKRIGDLFWSVYNELWQITTTYKETKKLYSKLDLEHYYLKNKKRYYVLSIPDVQHIAEKHGKTKDAVRKQLQRWSANKGPLKILRMTKPKNQGGQTIYAMGYWLDDTSLKKIQSFTKKKCKNWLRDVLFS
jgi:hypothetical protein